MIRRLVLAAAFSVAAASAYANSYLAFFRLNTDARIRLLIPLRKGALRPDID